MKSKYKYLLFDADNTLFDFNLSEHCALKATFEDHSVTLEDKDFEAYHYINDALWKKLERNEIAREELKVRRFARFAEYLNLHLDASNLSDTYISHLSKQCYLLDGAFELCEELSKSFPLYLITNGISFIQRSRFSKAPISGFFRDIFISEDMGVTKPSRAFFDYVAASIGDRDPANYLVIGDSLTSDIQGAVNFGCDSVWLAPKGSSDDRPTFTVNDLSEIPSIVMRQEINE